MTAVNSAVITLPAFLCLETQNSGRKKKGIHMIFSFFKVIIGVVFVARWHLLAFVP